LSKYWDHQLCIIDEVIKLMDKGYTCYLEQNISNEQKGNRGIFVDIFASKGNEKLIVEVGTCYHTLDEYKIRMPDAKVIFVHQWKNYGMNGDILIRMAREWQRIVIGWSDYPEARDCNLRDLEEKIWNLDRKVGPWI